ncbi:MAG: NnrS family protein, partial [Gammaproteobacteria bacterium]|nr:NnrS family protein [Gammaproteobacteria bacterium]
GWPLFLLSLIWIIPRILAFTPWAPNWTIALVDLSFIPLLTIMIAIPLIRTKSWSNLVFIPILLLMALSNLLVHASLLGWISLPTTTGTRLMLYLVILLIAIMGGRVIPFFTERGVSGVKTRTWPWIEKLSILSLALLAIADVFEANKTLVSSLAVLTTILHAIRLGGWYSNGMWTVPLVWVLHTAYAWIIVGLTLKSLAIISSTIELYAWHAFTVGGIGIVTLGMMARVSLGHTGRMMQASKWITLAFILINIATLIRIIFPIFFQTNYSSLIIISGFMWSIAFVLFSIVYTPIFLQSRVDGKQV